MTRQKCILCPKVQSLRAFQRSFWETGLPIKEGLEDCKHPHGSLPTVADEQTLPAILCREDFVIASKVAGPSGQMEWIRDGPQSLSAKNITEAIEGSLTRLKTDYLDLVQLHWPDRCESIFWLTKWRWCVVIFADFCPLLPRPCLGETRVGASQQLCILILAWCNCKRSFCRLPGVA